MLSTHMLLATRLLKTNAVVANIVRGLHSEATPISAAAVQKTHSTSDVIVTPSVARPAPDVQIQDFWAQLIPWSILTEGCQQSLQGTEYEALSWGIQNDNCTAIEKTSL